MIDNSQSKSQLKAAHFALSKVRDRLTLLAVCRDHGWSSAGDTLDWLTTIAFVFVLDGARESSPRPSSSHTLTILHIIMYATRATWFIHISGVLINILTYVCDHTHSLWGVHLANSAKSFFGLVLWEPAQNWAKHGNGQLANAPKLRSGGNSWWNWTF